jgi:hypothetical protein
MYVFKQGNTEFTKALLALARSSNVIEGINGQGGDLNVTLELEGVSGPNEQPGKSCKPNLWNKYLYTHHEIQE